MTGLVLTDELCSVTNQPSKLWSSASEFYWSTSLNVTTTMNSFSLNEVQQNIQALVKESSNAASDNFHFEPSESDPSQSLSDGPPRAPPSHNPLRSCLSQPAAFITPPKPLNGWVNRALGTITAVEATAREIGATLSFEDDNLPEDALL